MKIAKTLAIAVMPLALVFSATSVSAQMRTAVEAASPPLNQKQAAVEGVSADAQAVLSAIQADPKLLGELAHHPGEGEKLLRAHGATRAEHIMVSSGGGGAQRITITIKIDHVVIIIEL